MGLRKSRTATPPPVPQLQKKLTPDFEFEADDKVLNNFDLFEDTPFGNKVAPVMQAKLNVDNKSVVVTNHAQDLMKLYREQGDNPLSSKYGNDNIDPESEDGLYSTSRSKFCGGTKQEIYDSIDGKFDQDRFIKKRDQVRKKFSKLQELESLITRKRVRYMSEHDGELDHDRMWELNPFHATRFSNNGVARTIDVNVEMCLSAGVNPEAISEYGSTVWAVIDMLENAGIQCNVNIATTLRGLGVNKDPKPRIDSYRFLTTIKKAGEYIDTMDIARCFTSNFYRRVIFASWNMFCEASGRQTSYGFGYPYEYGSKNQNKKGVLNFKIEQMSNFNLNQDELIKYIKEAL
jgi:hypothetical protein